MSTIHVSGPEQTVGQIKNLFFSEQLEEEKILLELYSPNGLEISNINPNLLNVDHVFSKRQLKKRSFFGRFKWMDSAKYQERYTVDTILAIKNEQRQLNTVFKGYFVLVPRGLGKQNKQEPMLFTCVGENIYYLVNHRNKDINRISNLNKFQTWISTKTFLKRFFK